MSDTFLPRLETDIQPTLHKIVAYRMTNLEPDPDEPPALIGWHMVKERPQTAVVFIEKDPS